MREDFLRRLSQASAYFDQIGRDRIFLENTAAQLLYVAIGLILVRLFGPRLRAAINAEAVRRAKGPMFHILPPFARIVPWAILLLALWFGRVAFHEIGERARVLHLAENLVLAWIVIRLTSGLVRNPRVASAIAVAAWIFAALNILGLIDPTLNLLDAMSLNLGHFRLSVLIVLKGAVLLTVLLWLANLASRVLEYRLQTFSTIAPAMQVLVSKLAKAVLLTLAVVIALNAIGIDLTAFAVFSGAIGVGVGFGLQKVVSNLVSGVILLLDRSIKPGDVIEIAGTYGWITRLNARFVSVSTRDGIEHLIPNEDLITQRVTNWSYTNDLVRLHVQVSVGYDCDVHAAMALCIEATRDVKRVLDTPAPVCLLKEFGENAIALELRFWIHDPRNGTANIRSEVMLGIWDRFRDHGIAIPFPQRTLHVPDLDALAAKIGKTIARADEPPKPA